MTANMQDYNNPHLPRRIMGGNERRGERRENAKFYFKVTSSLQQPSELLKFTIIFPKKKINPVHSYKCRSEKKQINT